MVIHTVIRSYLTYRYLVGSTEGLGIGQGEEGRGKLQFLQRGAATVTEGNCACRCNRGQDLAYSGNWSEMGKAASLP